MNINPTARSNDEPAPSTLTKLATPEPVPPAPTRRQHEEEVNPLLERIRALSAREFAELITALLLRMGLADVTWVARGNRVIDMRGRMPWLEGSYLEGFVQARRVIRTSNYYDVWVARGSAKTGEPVILINTSCFTTCAKEEAATPNNTPVTLIDGRRLLDLLVEHNLAEQFKR